MMQYSQNIATFPPSHTPCPHGALTPDNTGVTERTEGSQKREQRPFGKMEQIVKI